MLLLYLSIKRYCSLDYHTRVLVLVTLVLSLVRGQCVINMLIWQTMESGNVTSSPCSADIAFPE